MLRGVPRRALHELGRRLRTVVRAHLSVAPAGPGEVGPEALAHRLAVARHRIAVGHLGWRVLLEPRPVERPQLPRIRERGGHPEHAQADLAPRPLPPPRLHATL